MTYSVHRVAEQELSDVAAFYRRTVNLRFAGKFFDEFERVAQLLDENPGAATDRGRRSARGARRYPCIALSGGARTTEAGVTWVRFASVKTTIFCGGTGRMRRLDLFHARPC